MIDKLTPAHPTPARMRARLAPTLVKGEWQPVAEQCAWKVNARDYKGAGKLM
jgi:hypothetical protein